MEPGKKVGGRGETDSGGVRATFNGRIGGATTLAARGASDAVIQTEGRWASKAFMRYVRVNMEDPIWVPEALVEERGWNRQPGQGTRWSGGVVFGS